MSQQIGNQPFDEQSNLQKIIENSVTKSIGFYSRLRSSKQQDRSNRQYQCLIEMYKRLAKSSQTFTQGLYDKHNNGVANQIKKQLGLRDSEAKKLQELLEISRLIY